MIRVPCASLEKTLGVLLSEIHSPPEEVIEGILVPIQVILGQNNIPLLNRQLPSGSQEETLLDCGEKAHKEGESGPRHEDLPCAGAE